MKKLTIITLLLFGVFVNSIYAQVDTIDFIEVEIVDFEIENGRTIGCTFGSGLCQENISIVPPGEVKNNDSAYGKFYIDRDDILRLSIDKSSISIFQLIDLFSSRKFHVSTQIHLPSKVSNLLGIKYANVIKNGDYLVTDSADNKSIVINFGKINRNDEFPTIEKSNSQKYEEELNIKRVTHDKE